MALTLTHAEVQGAVPEPWRVLLGRLHATFRTGDFSAGTAFAGRVAVAADEASHHPDVDLRYGLVHVSLVTHSAGGLTVKDIELARAVTQIAEELGHPGEALAPQDVEIAIDALDVDAVMPFWRAVLGYENVPGAPDLRDPVGIGPTVWFQQMDAPRPQRNRIHLDVTVPHDEAANRLAAAIDAGGRLLSDARAPAFWILADAEGNEACLCTWQARD